jgi:hypothetical protein
MVFIIPQNIQVDTRHRSKKNRSVFTKKVGERPQAALWRISNPEAEDFIHGRSPGQTTVEIV